MSIKVNSFNELENRCLEFSLNVKPFCKTIKQDIVHQVYISQVIRSSSSVGANYVEAKEREYLIDEADQLRKILSSIVTKLSTHHTQFNTTQTIL